MGKVASAQIQDLGGGPGGGVLVTLRGTTSLNNAYTPLYVVGDSTQLHQIMMNLCTNAIHAMPGGGTLRVSLEAGNVEAERVFQHTTLHAGRYARPTVEATASGMDRSGMQLPMRGSTESPLVTLSPAFNPSGARMYAFSPSSYSSKAMRAELIDQIITVLITTLFQSGTVAVKNEFITNPAAVGITKGISMIGEARKLLKTLAEEPEGEDGLELSNGKRISALLSLWEKEQSAKADDTKPGDTPEPPASPSNNPEKGS